MKNIGLIGFMATGKTTVGRILSTTIKRPFVDTDLLIEERTGMPIDRIFSKDGEQRFRDLEAEVIEELSRQDGYVISYGGGAILRPENRRNIRRGSVTILLRAAVCTLVSRIGGTTERPLLRATDLFSEMSSILKERAELYYETADFTIDTDSLTAREVAEAIARRLSC